MHALLERLGQLVRPVEKVFLRIGVERADRRRAGKRVARVGVAVEELHARTGGLHESLVDLLLHDHAAQRHAARGHALGERDHVRRNAEVLRGERLAQTAEAADHFVENEQDAVLRTDVAQLLQIALRRDEDAARARDRLDDHRRDVGGIVQGDDALLELVGELGARGRAPARECTREVVCVAQVVGASEQQPSVGLAVDRHARHRHAADVDAVVALLPADETRTDPFAAQPVVAHRHLHHRVDRLRAGVGEEDVVETLGREGGHALRDLEGERVSGGERGGEIELAGLLPDCVDDPRPAVARIHAPERRETVEHLAPVGELVVHVLRADDHLGRRLEARIVGVGHPEVLEALDSL